MKVVHLEVVPRYLQAPGVYRHDSWAVVTFDDVALNQDLRAVVDDDARPALTLYDAVDDVEIIRRVRGSDRDVVGGEAAVLDAVDPAERQVESRVSELDKVYLSRTRLRG